MRRRLIIIGSILLLGSVLIIILHGHKTGEATNNSPGSSNVSPSASSGKSSLPSPSKDTLNQLVNTDDNPSANAISYNTDSTTQPSPGWFVARVTASNEYGSFKQLAILKQTSGNSSLTLVAGPDISFPLSYLQSIGAPLAVINSVPIQTP